MTRPHPAISLASQIMHRRKRPILQGGKGSIVLQNLQNHGLNDIHPDGTEKKQRRMGVEPTRDRAERPPSRFEDGGTHRGPYTSICVPVFSHSPSRLSSFILPGQLAYPPHI